MPAKVDWSAELQRHAPWLRTVISARSGESQAVDEVFQEVAIAAVRQKAPLTDVSKVAPWLYQLAVRQSLMYRRKQGRRRRFEQTYAERRMADADLHTDPLSWLLSRERRQIVRKATEQLSPRDAEILMLKYTQDWSYQEIARHLGISNSAVEARLHRARTRLRQRLGELNVTEANT